MGGGQLLPSEEAEERVRTLPVVSQTQCPSSQPSCLSPPLLSIYPLLLPSLPSSSTPRTWVSSPLAHPEVIERLPLNPPSRFKMMSDPEQPLQPKGNPCFLVKKTQLISFLQGSKANFTFVTLHITISPKARSDGTDF